MSTLICAVEGILLSPFHPKDAPRDLLPMKMIPSMKNLCVVSHLSNNGLFSVPWGSDFFIHLAYISVGSHNFFALRSMLRIAKSFLCKRHHNFRYAFISQKTSYSRYSQHSNVYQVLFANFQFLLWPNHIDIIPIVEFFFYITSNLLASGN